MISCKNCHKNNPTKNGYVRGKQRYKCHNCGYHFVLGDERHRHATELKKALSVILYSLGKSSFGFLTKERHIIRKAYTHAIERDNSNTRHHLARMTRKTKVVSKSEDMIHASLKLWCALNVTAIFAKYQTLCLSIFT